MVFTNGLKTALELEHAVPRITVVVLGGTLRPLQHSLVDPLATHILERVSVGTLLLGCNGVHPTGGVTNINLPEAEIKRRMLEIASRRIVLADGSKIGRIELAHLCRADEIDMVITGESANEAIVESLREQLRGAGGSVNSLCRHELVHDDGRRVFVYGGLRAGSSLTRPAPRQGSAGSTSASTC